MAVIDYYFYSPSPFTYLGNDAIHAVAEKHGATLNYKIVDLFEIWADSGAVPPLKRPLVRQKMRLIELQRLALHRGLPLNKQPKFFPVDGKPADCTLLVLLEKGLDIKAYMRSVFEAVWVNDLDIADDDTLIQLLDQHGHDGKTVMSESKDPRFAEMRSANAKAALAANAPGVPAYVVNGECFWGQDRIEYLDEALTSGRPPITE